jgi:hypothetical protein
MARITLFVLVGVLVLAFVGVVAFVLYGAIFWTG